MRVCERFSYDLGGNRANQPPQALPALGDGDEGRGRYGPPVFALTKVFCEAVVRLQSSRPIRAEALLSYGEKKFNSAYPYADPCKCVLC